MSLRIRNIPFLFCCIPAIALLAFCGYYLSHSYEDLLRDYQLIHPCFYASSRFPDLFSPAVKQQGNLLCISAILLLPYCCYTVYRNGNKIRMPQTGYLFNRESTAVLVTLLPICAGISFFNITRLPLSTDEAFSAANFAQAPLSRLLTWYPLPNHHILFNLLNHFAGRMGGDYLLSGRILSAAFYYLLIAAGFLFFYGRSRNIWLALTAALVLSLQFMPWGFGSQARGYSLFYLLEWIAFLSLYRYFRNNDHDGNWLWILLCCDIAGIWLVPSFMYFIAFQLMAAGGIMLYRKQFHPAFFKTLLYTAAGVFLLYLPVFCYSGVAAVTANKYVNGAGQDSIAVLESWLPIFKDVVLPATWGFPAAWLWVNLLCLAAPLLIWFALRKKLPSWSGLLVYLYTCLWVSAFLVVLLQRQIPVIRTLGGHMQISLLVLLLLLAISVQSLKRYLRIGIYVPVCLLFAVLLLRYDKEQQYTTLYGQDTKAHWQQISQVADLIPEGTHVWVGDESFMCLFALRDKKVSVDSWNCSLQDQDFLVFSEDDMPPPATVLTHYHMLARSGAYMLWQRN